MFVTVLSLNCFTAENGGTAAKRCLSRSLLDQYIYIHLKSLDFKVFNSKDMLLWKSFAFVST